MIELMNQINQHIRAGMAAAWLDARYGVEHCIELSPDEKVKLQDEALKETQTYATAVLFDLMKLLCQPSDNKVC